MMPILCAEFLQFSSVFISFVFVLILKYFYSACSAVRDWDHESPLCPSLIATLILCVTPGVLAQPGEGGTFFNPPLGTDPSNILNPVWTLGQTQNIQWTTTLSNFTIFLYQQLGASSATKIENNNTIYYVLHIILL
jgi:type IV secretory pathway VirB6-like protein